MRALFGKRRGRDAIALAVVLVPLSWLLGAAH
jgi:hypothetical protein